MKNGDFTEYYKVETEKWHKKGTERESNYSQRRTYIYTY